MSRDVTLYVNDMIEACRRVVEYSEGIDRERLQADSMRNDAIVRNLEILGEAAKAVPLTSGLWNPRLHGGVSRGCATCSPMRISLSTETLSGT